VTVESLAAVRPKGRKRQGRRRRAKKTAPPVLRDHDIRHALWTKLATDLRECGPALALQEMAVNSRCGFADVVTINHELIGYEIKSDVDSTRRLPGQAVIYNDVFDRFYCVTAQTSAED